MRTLAANPPEDVEYRVAGSFHHGAPGAPSQRALEVALNRVVHPSASPTSDSGHCAFGTAST